MVVRAHVFITGNVQGVSFRYYTRQQANALGLGGWVRNVMMAPSFAKASEGQGVEAVFEGEKKIVNEMIAWCWEGSPSAQVSSVVVTWEEVEGLGDFTIQG